MCINRREFLASAIAATAAATTGCARGGETFECPPCGCARDGELFRGPGTCPACGMTLRPTAVSDLGHAPDKLVAGAGRLTLPGGIGRPDDRLAVDYYLPEGFTPQSPILLVVPGSGRDSAQQRNVWIAHAQATGTLVAALGFAESLYPFADYQLAGLARSVDTSSMQIERRMHSTIVRAEDSALEIEFNDAPDAWRFADFDRAFDHLVAASGSARQRYAIFGHSAGGQILHRMALFHPGSKASQLIAANAGFYTLPDLETPFPLGLAGTGLGDAALARALSTPLTVLLGERDNGDDAGGTLLHTPMLDRQGIGRLDRGRAFLATAEREAERLGIELAWRQVIVPGLGHDSRGAAEVAAGLLADR